MNEFLSRYNDDGSLFKLFLDGIRTYHKTIRGFDMFVYNLTSRGKSHGWVCIDYVTGACIDNKIWGHKLKEDAFISAEKKYDQYSDETILKAHQNAIRQLAEGKVSKEGFINK